MAVIIIIINIIIIIIIITHAEVSRGVRFSAPFTRSSVFFK